MIEIQYFVEVFSGDTWGIIPLCPPFTSPQQAETHRQKYHAKERNSQRTRVTKYRVPVNQNRIPDHVKTPSRATVLLPPGLGDLHWVLLKLQGFLSQNGFTGADVWIWDAGGPRRSAEFLSRIPFIHYVDYIEFRAHSERKALHEFCQIPDSVMRDKWGFDFVIALNGYLDAGLPLEDAMEGAPINWDYPIMQTEAELGFIQEEQKKGPWMLLYFSGLFPRWNEIVTPERVAGLIRMMQSSWPEHRIKMVGLPWDQGFSDKIKGVAFENLVDKTNPDQYFALLRGADAMVGFANGNTILTTYFLVPTIMIWSRDRYPHVGFRTNWVGPRNNYRPVEIEQFDPSRIIDILETLVSRRDFANV